MSLFHTPSKRQRMGRAVLVAVAFVVALGTVVLFVEPSARTPTSAQVPSPPPQLGACPQIDVFTGPQGAPYHDIYGKVIKKIITDQFPGSQVDLVATIGTVFNIDALADPAAARCWLSIAGINTAVDARYGARQFENLRIENLRTVGPLWLDFIQLIVHTNSGINDVADLCQHKTLATGPRDSGTRQITDLLLQALQNKVPGCRADQNNISGYLLKDALDRLENNQVDAVLWNAAAPTPVISEALTKARKALTLAATDRYIKEMQDAWDLDYGARGRRAQFPGNVYVPVEVSSADYTNINAVGTIGVPNEIVVNAAADDQLVGFVADLLVSHRADFERELWKNDQNRRFCITKGIFCDWRDEINNRSLYCLVPLHVAAEKYYRDKGVHPAAC